jgi:hypothetical protein
MANVQMRRTSSGWWCHGKYQNETPQSTITRQDDIRATADLAEQSKWDRIETLVDEIKAAGFSSLFDFLLEFLQFTPKTEIIPLRKWLRGNGTLSLPSFVEACIKHGEFHGSDSLNGLAIRLAEVQLNNEMRKLMQSKSFRRPLSSFTIDRVSHFSLDHFQRDLNAVAPTLVSLLESLIRLPAREPTTSRSDSNPTPRDPLSDWESDEDPRDPMSDWESDEEALPLTSNTTLPETKTRSLRKLPLKRRALQMVMSVLLYGRSQKSNLIPGLLSYFLHSCRVPKRALEALHQFGICVSYKSVVRGMKAIAKDSAIKLRDLAATFPPLFAYVDNMNFYSRVRDQRLDNRAEQQNYTVGYVGLNPCQPEQRMLFREVPTKNLRTLGAEDLLPTEDNIVIYGTNCWATVSAVLHSYYGGQLDRHSVQPRPYMAVFRLSREPMKIFTLPAYDLNEANIDEMTEVLQRVMQALGYKREDVANRTIPFSGDFLSTRNIRFIALRHPWI